MLRVSKLFLTASTALYILSSPGMAMDQEEGNKGKSSSHPTATVTVSQAPQEDQAKEKNPPVTCFNLKKEFDTALVATLQPLLPGFAPPLLQCITSYSCETIPVEFARTRWLAAPQPTGVSFAHCSFDDEAMGSLLRLSRYKPTQLHIGHNRVSDPSLGGGLPEDLTYYYCGDNPLTDEGMQNTFDFFIP